MITEFSFGRIEVEGQIFNNDIKIVEGKLVPNWWRRSGHSVEIDDVQDILDSDSEILVIGRGQPGYMKITDDLRGLLEKNKIKLIEEPTREAIRTFNRLHKKDEPVSGGFHVGC